MHTNDEAHECSSARARSLTDPRHALGKGVDVERLPDGSRKNQGGKILPRGGARSHALTALSGMVARSERSAGDRPLKMFATNSALSPNRRYGAGGEAASWSVRSSRELCSWAKRRGPRISAIRIWAAPASA
jgi:hypothetical protein